MSQLIFLAPSGGTVTLANADTASDVNVTLPAQNGTLLITDSSNNLTVNNLTVTGQGSFTSTGAVLLSVGTTVQRPTSPVNGMIRYNTDSSGYIEAYAGNQWVKLSSSTPPNYNITALVVAGGGSGGGWNYGGGGGGAGGFLTSTVALTIGTVYTITVGAGATNAGVNTNGVAGSNSSIGSLLVSNGGGAGGGQAAAGGAGGSGGGGCGLDNQSSGAAGGAGVSGQGFNGGAGTTSAFVDGNGNTAGGGGGGAGGAGGNAGSYAGGGGGAGLTSAITGTTLYYAAGGGGAAIGAPGTPVGGTGGSGIGGNGSSGPSTSPTNGTTNRGAGGGGSQQNAAPGNGGSGVVILSIPTASYSGTKTGSPTVSTVGSNTVLVYTSSGSYTG